MQQELSHSQTLNWTLKHGQVPPFVPVPPLAHVPCFLLKMEKWNTFFTEGHFFLNNTSQEDNRSLPLHHTTHPIYHNFQKFLKCYLFLILVLPS